MNGYKIVVPNSGIYLYCTQPERQDDESYVTVSCNPYDRGTASVIRSPRLVVELLSPSTEARDRGRKLQCYTTCPSIEEYLLVDARAMRIEIYRKEQKKWVYEAFAAGDEVRLTTLDVSFSLEDVYEDVIFEKEESNK